MADTDVLDHGSRPMPAFVRKGLINIKGAGVYLKAAYCVMWFREDHPDWTIVTEIVQADENFALMRAEVRDETGRTLSTGHKTCTRQAFPAGHVEKAETGSIARALAVLGYGTQYGELADDDAGMVATSPVSGRAEERVRSAAEQQPEKWKPAAVAPVQAPAKPRPTADPDGPASDFQRAAIENLSRKRGEPVPDGLESLSAATAAEWIKKLQERAA